MAERMVQPPGITQGDMGPRYTRKRLADEVYIGHYIKAGDRIRVRSTILTGVIASLTTVNLTIGGRVQGMDGDLVPFGDSLTFAADGAQTARYVMAPEGYVVDLIVESTSTGLTSGDLTVVVDIVQGTGSNAVAVGLLAYGYVYPAGLLGLNVSRNIGGGSGGGMAIGGTVTSGTAGSVLFVNTGPVLAQDNTNFKWDTTNKTLLLAALPTTDPSVAGALWNDGGTIVVSGSTGRIRRVPFSLTNAQILALPTTPVQVLAALGAGHVFTYLATKLRLNMVGAYTNVDIANGLYMSGSSPESLRSEPGFVADGPGDYVVPLPPYFISGTPTGYYDAYASYVAGAVFLVCSNGVLGNFTGGNVANTLTGVMWYIDSAL